MRVILLLLVGLVLAVAGPAFRRTLTGCRPGDVLDVNVFQDPKLNRQIVVAPDGYVAFPLAGRFKAGGLTTSAVETALRPRAAEAIQHGPGCHRELHPVGKAGASALKEAKDAEYTVYVTGEVGKPGAFVVPKRPPTVMQALALAGGLGPFASERRIQVIRKAKGEDRVFQFNYRDYTKGHDMGGNITLRNGDVVVVPERGLFQ